MSEVLEETENTLQGRIELIESIVSPEFSFKESLNPDSEFVLGDIFLGATYNLESESGFCATLVLLNSRGIVIKTDSIETFSGVIDELKEEDFKVRVVKI